MDELSSSWCDPLSSGLLRLQSLTSIEDADILKGKLRSKAGAGSSAMFRG